MITACFFFILKSPNIHFAADFFYAAFRTTFHSNKAVNFISATEIKKNTEDYKSYSTTKIHACVLSLQTKEFWAKTNVLVNK